MSDQLSRCFKQVMRAQLSIAIIIMIAAGVFYGWRVGASVLLGAVLAIANTTLSQRSIKRASALAYKRPDASMLPVFSGLIQRLLLFAAGFSGGVLLLSLSPLSMLIGFGLTQAGYLACKMR